MSKDSGIRFSAHGGVGNATGANFLVRAAGTSFLVDCGLVQGGEFATEENRAEFGYIPSEIPHLIITHAHMDHIGRIPKLVRDGFAGKIHSTPETKELAAIMLPDAWRILDREARENDREPLYGEEDISKALSLWTVHPYHDAFSLAPGIDVSFKDAGHILGSVIALVSVGGEKIAFTGDLGNSPSPLLRDAEIVDDATYMVIESVYGDRNHEGRDQRTEKLRAILDGVLKRGGTAVIPAFSIERTQVILYAINELIESGSIPSVPVFLDSPLATKATAIYKQGSRFFNEGAKGDIESGDDIFNFKTLRIVRDGHESENIHHMKGPKVIIAGSGMSVGGRVVSHEKRYLHDPNSAIIFVGYQAAGSLGRRIEEGAKEVTIEGEKIRIRARIESVSGYSSHMDSDHLVEFVSHSSKTLKKAFVAMGEPKSSAFLAQRLRDEAGVEAVVPEKGKIYDL